MEVRVARLTFLVLVYNFFKNHETQDGRCQFPRSPECAAFLCSSWNSTDAIQSFFPDFLQHERNLYNTYPVYIADVSSSAFTSSVFVFVTINEMITPVTY